ncbi:MAG: PH domain-containing protein [Candidatus Hadarchaeum sp.]
MREKILWAGSPALVAFYGFYAIGALALVLTAISGAAIGLPLWVWGIVLPFCSAMFILPLFFQHAWRFIVSNRVVRCEFDFLVCRSAEAPLNRITNLVVNQDIVSRLLNIGEIRFDTAGTPFPGISFWGVRSPSEVANKIRFFILEAGEK